MTAAQIAYETKRAAKAGVSLDKWLDMKRRQQAAEAKERQQAAQPAPKKKDNFISRLLDRAHKPL